jgi:CRP-like cAMP-binding protein
MKTAKLLTGRAFIAKIDRSNSVIKCIPKKAIFVQGDPSDAIFYVHSGKIKLAVVSKQGKEAVVAILSTGDFLGEECLAGQARRISTATPLTDSEIVRIAKDAAVKGLREDAEFSELFLAYLLERNLRAQEDLVDQLFNSTEKRLARVLIMLADDDGERQSAPVIPKISQETLAEMVGTTRSRINYFMNKFRKQGFIRYNGTLEVNSSLLNSVLYD